MEQVDLQVKTRSVTGKKVKTLRKTGMTPVNLYGHGFESMSLQAETSKLAPVITRIGGSRLVKVRVNDEARPRPVLIREVEKHPITGKYYMHRFSRCEWERRSKSKYHLLSSVKPRPLRVREMS